MCSVRMTIAREGGQKSKHEAGYRGQQTVTAWGRQAPRGLPGAVAHRFPQTTGQFGPMLCEPLQDFALLGTPGRGCRREREMPGGTPEVVRSGDIRSLGRKDDPERVITAKFRPLRLSKSHAR
jgi:hypothetical protein